MHELRQFILEDISGSEHKRMQTLLCDLKDLNKKLQSTNKAAVLQKDFYVTKEERQRITKIVSLMVQHYRTLFKDFISSPVNDQVHPMVKLPITFLEKKGLRHKDLLGNSKEPPPAKVEKWKEAFYSGKDVKIPDSTDPYVISQLLKEYLRDLNEPLCTYKRYTEFDNINDIAPANMLKELRASIEELPKVRRFSLSSSLYCPEKLLTRCVYLCGRATLTVLIGFLNKVSRFSDDNGMAITKLADLFGPLLLRPFKEK